MDWWNRSRGRGIHLSRTIAYEYRWGRNQTYGAEPGATANDHACHGLCSEQHTPRQAQSSLSLNVRQIGDFRILNIETKSKKAISPKYSESSARFITEPSARKNKNQQTVSKSNHWCMNLYLTQKLKPQTPNQALEPTTLAVTDCAPRRTLRAS